MSGKRLPILLAALLVCFAAQAQGGGDDFMRSTGKIYVVVAVIVAVFMGLVVFLLYLDRRVTKIEDQINEHD